MRQPFSLGITVSLLLRIYEQHCAILNLKIKQKAMTTAAVSAPGKVLLAGGYLVLDRAYQGLVFGLDARIHVCVQVPKTSDTNALQQKIVVQSPQFQKAHWVYSHIASKDGVRVSQSDE
jgi:phosphomevalonate kinase